VTDAGVPYGDPLTVPFWEAARRHELTMPRCVECGRFEWYPRGFCLACGGGVAWERLTGRGRIYSQTTVRVAVTPELEPPYVVAIVELDEGPRMLTTLDASDGTTAIGDPVTIAWRDRDPEPPLPVFRPDRPTSD
jgi:hypothetical protein